MNANNHAVWVDPAKTKDEHMKDATAAIANAIARTDRAADIALAVRELAAAVAVFSDPDKTEVPDDANETLREFLKYDRRAGLAAAIDCVGRQLFADLSEEIHGALCCANAAIDAVAELDGDRT